MPTPNSIEEIRGVVTPVVNDWRIPSFTEVQVDDAMKTVAERPSIVASLNCEISKMPALIAQLDVEGRCSIDHKRIAAQSNKVAAAVAANADFAHKLLILESAKSYFAGLFEAQREYALDAKRWQAEMAEFERKRAYRLNEQINWANREGKALTESIDRLQERLTILRGKLSKDGLSEWIDLVDDALSGFRGSLSAAMTSTPGGNLVVKESGAA